MKQDLREQSVGDLLANLARDTSLLVRQEVRLASAEMTGKAKEAANDVGIIGVGVALAHLGLLAVVAGIVVGLGAFIPMWISAMVVGTTAIIVGYGLTHYGRSALGRIDPLPTQALEAVQGHGAWDKEQVHGH
jgi:hypothetical protein